MQSHSMQPMMKVNGLTIHLVIYHDDVTDCLWLNRQRSV